MKIIYFFVTLFILFEWEIINGLVKNFFSETRGSKFFYLAYVIKNIFIIWILFEKMLD